MITCLISTDYDPIRHIWILTKIRYTLVPDILYIQLTVSKLISHELQCGTPLHPLVDQWSIAAGFTIITFIYHGGGIKSDWGPAGHHGTCTNRSRPSHFKLSKIRRFICIFFNSCMFSYRNIYRRGGGNRNVSFFQYRAALVGTAEKTRRCRTHQSE